LTPGRGDDHLEHVDARLAGKACVSPNLIGGFLELFLLDEAEPLDLNAEAERGSLLSYGLERASLLLGDQKPHRVRPHVDNPDHHDVPLFRSSRSDPEAEDG
jgi:hypothetical protein